jgi:hypothetical protein
MGPGALLSALVGAVACSDAGAADGFDFPSDGFNGTGATTGDNGNLGEPSEPTVPPEVELEESFRQPVVSGSLLFSANPQTNRIALIDASSLDIQVVDGGNGPTYLAPLSAGETGGGALVTNVRSNNASVLLLDDQGDVTSQFVPLQAGASAWATGPLGRHAVSWSRATEGLLGSGDGYQDIMVLSFKGKSISKKQLSVGYRPSKLLLNQAETRAYAVSEPGLTVIDLSLDEPDVAREIFLPDAGGGARDVSLTPDGALAFVRLEGQSDILVVDTETGEQTPISLPGPVTDLDLSEDGTRAVAVIRTVQTAGAGMGGAGAGLGGAAGSAGMGPLEPPTTSDTQSQIVVLDVQSVASGSPKPIVLETDEYVGSVVLSQEGDFAVLFTNAIQSSRVVLLDLEAEEMRAVDVKVPAQAGFISPDGSFAVMLLAGVGTPGAFAVIPLTESRPVRIQGAASAPRFVSVTDDRALVTTQGSTGTFAEAFLTRYPELSVDRHELPSMPLSTGIVAEAGQAFIAQEHPEGRVTFVDLDSGQPRTVTGFELSSRVVD